MADTGNTRQPRSTRHDMARAAALSLIKRGLATRYEAARLAGVPRQTVYYWATEAGYSADETRDEYLNEEWHKALKTAEKSS